MQEQSVIISGLGSYAPPNIVTNDDLAKRIDTSDEWIRGRTGIRERRIADKEDTCSEMAAKAARKALEDAGMDAQDIDLIIVATITPDMVFPSTAALVQDKLGMRKVPSFDVEAACSGFIYILEIACSMLRSGSYRNALIIGAEKLSAIIDWSDRSTCVLFGDGAGAAVLTKTDEPSVGVLANKLGADGSQAELLLMPAGGSLLPATEESVTSRQHYLKMNGREIFKSAVKVMGRSAEEILEEFGLEPDDISCIIPHQANYRIIDAIANRLKIPIEKFPMNLDRYGNTSAASIPLILDEAFRKGRIKSGDYILLVAFGAGLTWAATLIKWK